MDLVLCIHWVLLPWAWPSGIVETYQFGFGGDAYIFTEAEEQKFVVAVEPNGKQSTTWGKIKTATVFQNYPNPFKNKLIQKRGFRITFLNPVMLRSQSLLQVENLVREFKLGQQARGDKKLYWDGKKR